MKNLQENVVPVLNQNKENVFLHDNSGIRILFVGNSITKHAPKPQIGWYRDCGMAASGIEKDYVHLIVEKVKEYDENVSFCIAQVAPFEWYFAEKNIIPEYKQASDYNADIIIMFFGANVSKEYDKGNMPEANFGDEYEKLCNYLNQDGHAKVFHSQGFYIRPVLDEEKRRVAEKLSQPYISLEDIVKRDDVRGEFNHPNDLGMQLIADKFWSYIEDEVKELVVALRR